MEVWIFAILIGIWFSVLLLGAGVLIGRGLHDKRNDNVIDKGMDERKPVLDSSDLSDVQCGCGDRGGNQSDYLGLDDEAVKGILTVMRMSVRYSEAERLAIDYCLDRLEAENG
jgi:hypothetical protein